MEGQPRLLGLRGSKDLAEFVVARSIPVAIFDGRVEQVIKQLLADERPSLGHAFGFLRGIHIAHGEIHGFLFARVAGCGGVVAADAQVQAEFARVIRIGVCMSMSTVFICRAFR